MIHLLFLQAALAEPPEPPAVEDPKPTPQELQQQIQALQAEVEALRAEQARQARQDLEDQHRVSFGAPVVVPRGHQVDEVVSFGNDVQVDGHVLGNAVSFGGDVGVSRTGRVDGDVVSFGGQISVQEGGQVGGNRVAMELPVTLPVAQRDVSADPAGATAGSLHLATDAGALLHTLYRRAVFLLSVAGAGVLVVGLFPTRVNRVAQDLEARPVRAAVVGTLATGFLSLFAGLFTVVTLGLGLPVSVLLIGLLGLAWLLGFVGLCQAVGDRLPLQDRPHGRWIAFVVGVVLITFLGSLPWVGWLVVGGVSVLGIGSALTTRFGRN